MIEPSSLSLKTWESCANYFLQFRQLLKKKCLKLQEKLQKWEGQVVSAGIKFLKRLRNNKAVVDPPIVYLPRVITNTRMPSTQVKTRTKHFPWHIISLTCWLLCLITLVASLTAWSYSYDPPDRYDAASESILSTNVLR